MQIRLKYAYMTTKRNQSSTRLIIAISLFAAALVSAVALTALGNQRERYWVAAQSISPGMEITQSNLASIDVALGANTQMYLSGKTSPIGAIATRPISEGELLPLSALEESGGGSGFEQVPLIVRGGDIPGDINVGEEINIYWVPEPMGAEVVREPALVKGNIFLQSIDRKGTNFGNDLGITVLARSSDVLGLLASTVNGRLVIVRSRG